MQKCQCVTNCTEVFLSNKLGLCHSWVQLLQNFPIHLFLSIASDRVWNWNSKDKITFPWPSAPSGKQRSLAPHPPLLPTSPHFLSLRPHNSCSLHFIYPPSFACPFLIILVPTFYKFPLDSPPALAASDLLFCCWLAFVYCSTKFSTPPIQ